MNPVKHFSLIFLLMATISSVYAKQPVDIHLWPGNPAAEIWPMLAASWLKK